MILAATAKMEIKYEEMKKKKTNINTTSSGFVERMSHVYLSYIEFISFYYFPYNKLLVFFFALFACSMYVNVQYSSNKFTYNMSYSFLFYFLLFTTYFYHFFFFILYFSTKRKYYVDEQFELSRRGTTLIKQFFFKKVKTYTKCGSLNTKEKKYKSSIMYFPKVIALEKVN